MSNYLKVRNIWKSYRLGSKKLDVLRGLSLEVEKGEMLAVTGHSGCGKTTLLHVLGTLDEADKGEISFGEMNVMNLKGKELERFRNDEIGFVFQFFQLLPEFTALENAMMPLMISGKSKSESKLRALEVLNEVGLARRVEHLPNQLSGGEQQRAAIARALVCKPKLLLADEPTGNLDTATGDRVFALLHDLQKRHELTSIIVTHNQTIASKCDRVLEMDSLNISH